MLSNEGTKSSKIGGTYIEKGLPLKIRNVFIVSRLASGSRKFITAVALEISLSGGVRLRPAKLAKHSQPVWDPSISC